MPCPLCGDICRCSSDGESAVSSHWLAEDDSCLPSVVAEEELQCQEAHAAHAGGSAETAIPATSRSTGIQPGAEDSPAWRQAVTARLDGYHSQRNRPMNWPRQSRTVLAFWKLQKWLPRRRLWAASRLSPFRFQKSKNGRASTFRCRVRPCRAGFFPPSSTL